MLLIKEFVLSIKEIKNFYFPTCTLKVSASTKHILQSTVKYYFGRLRYMATSL